MALESRNERGDAIVQPDLAFIDQDHHAGGRRDHFGERCEIEDRVRRHRLGRLDKSAPADCFVIQRALAEADEHDRSRQPPLGDGILNQGFNGVEP